MFVALRDLRFARGRFVLIGAVVALITVLVGFLSGLTGGLAAQNVSAVLALPADRVVFGGGTEQSFSDSVVTEQQASSWESADGVSAVEPVGISQTSAEAGNARAAVSLFGVRPTFGPDAPTREGTLTLSVDAAETLDVQAGAEVAVAGTTYTVAAVAGDGWYSHAPVVQMTLQDWQTYSAATGAPGADATVLAVSGDPDWAATDESAGTTSSSVLGSVTALSAFTSEIGSLLLMVVMLFGISGLVVGAFFTVWTMQRQVDVAVLKALGASTRSLVRDALGQAAVVLLLGTGVGLGVVVLLGTLAGTALPFALGPVTTLLPAAVMIVLGLAGAGVALRPIISADPLTALGSNR